MYIPPSFAEHDEAVMQAFIEAHPLGALVTASPSGLFATHLPLVLDREVGARGTLQGHIARANPHHELAGEGAEALVLFTGADSYVTPSMYASKAKHGKVVPTWNYVAVHAHGTRRAARGRGRSTTRPRDTSTRSSVRSWGSRSRSRGSTGSGR